MSDNPVFDRRPVRRSEYSLTWAGHRLTLGRRTRVMGIVNVTPDSFSDGGRFFDRDAAVAQGERLAAEGADILDIGGESTRPFADAVPDGEEKRRVIPVIERLAGRVTVPISIDTTKASVARAALDAGASIINDVGALRLDPDLAGVAAAAGVPVILMHMLGTPRTMQIDPHYDDLTGELTGFLADAIDRATAAGIDRSRIIIDPGIGFGKTVAHNLRIIARLDAFRSLDRPILAGASRKAFIRKLLGPDREPPLSPDRPEVAAGSQAVAAAAILSGAHIIRVHDVAEAVATARIIDAIAEADETAP